MRAKVFKILLCVFFLRVDFSQSQENDGLILDQPCATMMMDSIRRTIVPQLGTLVQFEDWLQEKILKTSYGGIAKTEVSYTLPVVVHVIHNGEAVGSGLNISDAQINSQIDVLNEDFRKVNSGISRLSEPPYSQTNWLTIAADCQINFCLAKNEPGGTALTSPGIDRINRITKSFEEPPFSLNYIENVIKPATIWDPNKYMNIWVLKIKESVIGYATFPVNSNLTGLTDNFGTATTDGIVLSYRTFGRVGNVQPPYNKGRTTTHEVGHWLGLRHIWGEDGGSCSSDYCNDTPSQFEANSACPAFPHVSCNNGPNGDMFINYMDYGPDDCLLMFTNDQKTRIQTVMANCPFRGSLVAQSTNCLPTAIDEYSAEKLTVYPNPSTGKVYVHIPDDIEITNIEIRNVLGEKIHEIIEDQFSDGLYLDFSNANNSIYFIDIGTVTKHIIKKIIISK